MYYIGSWLNSAHCLLLQIKIYWNAARSTCYKCSMASYNSRSEVVTKTPWHTTWKAENRNYLVTYRMFAYPCTTSVFFSLPSWYSFSHWNFKVWLFQGIRTFLFSPSYPCLINTTDEWLISVKGWLVNISNAVTLMISFQLVNFEGTQTFSL